MVFVFEAIKNLYSYSVFGFLRFVYMTTKMAEEQQEIPAETAEPAAEPDAAPAAPSGEEVPETQEAPAAAEGEPAEQSEQPEQTAEGEEAAAAVPEGETPAEDAGAEAAPPAEVAETQEASGEPAAEQSAEGDSPAEGSAEGGEPPVEGSPPVEGEAPSVTEGEAAPAEGEGGEGPPAEGAEPSPTAEGEEKPDEGEGGEGGEAPAQEEGDAEAPAQEGAAEGGDEEAAAPAAEGTADGEAPAEDQAPAAEGEAPADEQQPPAEDEDEERPSSPAVEVSAKLSREATPEPGEEPETARIAESPPVPGTPDEQGSLREGTFDEEEEEFEEEEEVPQFDRDQLIEKYHQSLSEREQLQQHNYQLQHKLAEYFRKKKSDDARQDVDKNVTDQEQRYLKYMANLEELRHQDADERDTFKLQIEDLRDRCGDKEGSVKGESDKFMEFKKQVALNAVNSRSGKPIAPKDIEQYIFTDNRKEKEVVDVRLENIKLKNKLRKKELQLKSKEELAEGLHLIDFEQLKIENQTYNEKIEERNEELLKLRKKITGNVQVLTHLKEKLQFVQAENHVLKGSLRNVEDDAAKKRDRLTRTKQSRDHLRIDNHRLRQNCGLLGNEPLLRDFEDRKDESDDLRSQLDQLKMQHAELTLCCNGVRKKIDQARQGQA